MFHDHEVIEVDPEKMHGTPVFRGTRVPIQHLFDYLEGGKSVDIFIDHFPTVSHNQVMDVLELLKSRVLIDDAVAV
ncbi:MAG: DUF433 domain-containing protein [Pyrinomonadaceae bacterium]